MARNSLEPLPGGEIGSASAQTRWWRNCVFEGVDLALLVVAEDGLVEDANPSARKMLRDQGIPLRRTCRLPRSLHDWWNEGGAEPCTVTIGGRVLEAKRVPGAGSSGGQAPDGQAEGGLAVVSLRPSCDATVIEQELRRAQLELAAANHRLERLAASDPLTGVANRRELMRVLSRELDRVGRHDRPLGLVMIDLDAFKEVNDCHGHAAGDALLLEVARAQVELTRGSDLVARLGGDEFVIVLPETTVEGTAALAERIRSGLGMVSVPWKDQEVSVTCSIGATTVEGGTFTPDELLAVADDLLYEAKKTGRDRVFYASPSRERVQEAIRPTA